MTSTRKAYLGGGGIGSLAAAALLVNEQNKTAGALVLAEQNATEAQKESQLATHSKKLAQSAARSPSSRNNSPVSSVI